MQMDPFTVRIQLKPMINGTPCQDQPSVGPYTYSPKIEPVATPAASTSSVKT